MPSLPILVTDRIYLRPCSPDDVLILHRIWTDPQVSRFLWDGNPVSLGESEITLDTCLRFGAQTGLGLWRMTSFDETILGFCGFWPRSNERVPEIFAGLKPRHWGQGFALEAVTAILAYAFDRRLADEIIASCSRQNQRSRRLSEKLGFTFEKETEFEGRFTRYYRLSPEGLKRESAACLEAAAVPA